VIDTNTANVYPARFKSTNTGFSFVRLDAVTGAVVGLEFAVNGSALGNIQMGSNTEMSFNVAGGTKVGITYSSFHVFHPQADNDVDLGFSNERWRAGWFSALVSAPTFRTVPAAFSALAACAAGTEGTTGSVTDSTTTTLGATVAGGGSGHIQAYCDGTNWTVAAQ
jgi:hypothetical protein